MTAPEFAHRYRDDLKEVAANGGGNGFEKIEYGIIEHSELYEVVGFRAQQREPTGHYDGLSLRMIFLSFPAPQVEFRLDWTSWMAAPSLKVRADYPPLVLKVKILRGASDTSLQQQGDRFLSLLSCEVDRGMPPSFLSRLWIRLAR